MRASDLDLIFVPAPGELSTDHWMARWNGKLSTARIVDTPGSREPIAIADAIVEVATVSNRPILLVGHSFGALAIALAAPRLKGADVRGAFLVAVPTILGAQTASSTSNSPRARLPWRSVMVASRTDPWSPFSESEMLAGDWGADLVDAGEAGRVDADSGFGPWPDGLLRLAGFLRTF